MLRKRITGGITLDGENKNKYLLGGVPRRTSEAHVAGTYLGYAIINSPEGMVERRIDVPRGVKAVDAEYVLDQVKNGNTPLFYRDGHEENDNLLQLGSGKVHPISKGFVLVTDPTSEAKFEGLTLEDKEVVISTAPNIHLNLDTEEISFNDNLINEIFLSKGKGSR